jgi:phosphohistidine phosphatase
LKQVIIVRHAKSSWDAPGMRDFDRPLNERGLRDAPVMAQRLLDKGVAVDAFVSSTAKRALTTARLFAEKYNVPAGSIIEHPLLYHAPPEVFYSTIEAMKDAWQTIVVFSHNPGITAFVNELTTARIDDMPTCGVFAVQAEITHWKDFRASNKHFWFFDYPKAF